MACAQTKYGASQISHSFSLRSQQLQSLETTRANVPQTSPTTEVELAQLDGQCSWNHAAAANHVSQRSDIYKNSEHPLGFDATLDFFVNAVLLD